MAVANLLKKGGVPKPKPKEPSKSETRSLAGETLRNREIGLLPSRSKVSKPSGITKEKSKTTKPTVVPVPRPNLWLDPDYSNNKELGSMVGGPGGNESTTSKRGKERLDMELKDIYESTTGNSIKGDISSVLNKNLKDKYAKLVLLLKYKNSDYKTFALHTIKFGYVSTFYHDFLKFLGKPNNNFKSYDNLFWYLIKDPQSSNSFIKEENQMIPQQVLSNNISKSRQPSQANQMMQSMSSSSSNSRPSSSRSRSRSRSPSTQVMQNSQNQSGLDLITLLEKISITIKNNSIIKPNNSNNNNNNNNNNNRQNAALNAQIEEITNGMRRTGINTNRLTIDNINELFGQMRIKRII